MIKEKGIYINYKVYHYAVLSFCLLDPHVPLVHFLQHQ